MKNNVINLSLFIVPNSGTRQDVCLDFIKKSNKERLGWLGIKIADDEILYQVWVHCPEEGLDNCTDHGYSVRQIKLLGLKEEEFAYAPHYFPANILLNVKEGEVRSYTAPNGCTINIRFEQLPYRYRRFGTIDEVAKRLVFPTKENIEFHYNFQHKKEA